MHCCSESLYEVHSKVLQSSAYLVWFREAKEHTIRFVAAPELTF